MFQESLLESSKPRFGRQRTRWPMLFAVAVEAIVCGALIALPLLSSGTIALAAHTSTPVPLHEPPHPRTHPPQTPIGGSHGTLATASYVVSIASARSTCVINCQSRVDEGDISPDTTLSVPGGPGLPEASVTCVKCRPRGPAAGPARISTLAPGALIYRVEPVYPRILATAQVHGIVRLHAIIATNGTVKSLTVMEGSPLLVAPAIDAVQRWRYRPYILNGQPVEVETIITVNFR